MTNSTWGDQTKPKPTSDAYRNATYWDKLEERKKKERKEAEDDLKKLGLM